MSSVVMGTRSLGFDTSSLRHSHDDFNLHHWLYNEVLKVLEYALRLNNPACLESALHGLGHLQVYAPDRVQSIIQNLIVRYATQAKHLPELLLYVDNASSGCVQ
jgi:hypothetical protein